MAPPRKKIPTKATEQLAASLTIGRGRAESLMPKCFRAESVTGDTKSPPRIELKKAGPMNPSQSILITLLMMGWIFLSQSPVRNPEDPPTHMQAPMLGMNPAAEARHIPPESEPMSESLRLSLPLRVPERQVVIMLVAMQKQRLRGPRDCRMKLGDPPPASKLGQRMPVKGKVAKIKPTPMRTQQAERFVSVFFIIPFLESAKAGKMLKQAAKRQMQLVPQSSKALVMDWTWFLSMESARMKVRVHPILKTILHPNISSSPILPMKEVNARRRPQSRTIETRMSMRPSLSSLPASAPYKPVFSLSPMSAKYQILSQMGAIWTVTPTARRVLMKPPSMPSLQEERMSPKPRRVRIESMVWMLICVSMRVRLPASQQEEEPKPQAKKIASSNSRMQRAKILPLLLLPYIQRQQNSHHSQPNRIAASSTA